MTYLLASSADVRAKRVTKDQLAQCGKRLRQGDLVAFPTETVYGLGCHALDESACRKVFAAKERPLTDPLIVHVCNAEEAFRLWEATSRQSSSSGLAPSLQAQILTILCKAFWPGPLTIVAAAAPTVVPDVVMAGTGFVAVRSPRHTLARDLLQAAGVPVAAPSANKFGHVSPTTAQHVWDDLQYENVWILESSSAQSSSDTFNRSCQEEGHVGVESSVVKLEMNNDEATGGTLTLLRQGAVAVEDLRKALHAAGIDQGISVVTKSHEKVNEVTATVSPGQNIRHYSPNVPSFLLSPECVESWAKSSPSSFSRLLRDVVVLDFGQQCAAWQESLLAYRDLSATGESAQAAQWIYESLRWAEQIPNAKYILFAPLVSFKEESKLPDALLLAVQDRLIRAASGVILESLDALVSDSS
jgi:tRNA threonylcarbamoyl adenosine modification protein (Sua5/YciO/YrdC/YwlC family)